MADKPKRPVGRPSLFTEELANTICERVAEGESLRRICRDDGMPERRTVERWLAQDPDFVAKYACAREAQADLMDERQMEIVEQVLDRTLDPNAAKVAVGVIQWRAAKLAPKRYGDKIDINHSGAVDVSDAALDARILALGSSVATALGQAASSRITQAA